MSHSIGYGAFTTRPSNAKKIDLDPMSKRTIIPDYSQPDPPKPRQILQPSNVLNQAPTQSTNTKRSMTPNSIAPKANLESQPQELPIKRVLKACDLKNYDYSSQIVSLPFGNHPRDAQNDLSMMPRSNISRVNGTNPSWMLKKMNDFRSELENLPGSYNSRIPKQDNYSCKNVKNYMNRITMTSKPENFEVNPKRKFVSENEKRCVKEIDIRESKVKQFNEKKHFLDYSHEEQPIIKQEFMKGKPKSSYRNAFKSNLQIY